MSFSDLNIRFESFRLLKGLPTGQPVSGLLFTSTQLFVCDKEDALIYRNAVVKARGADGPRFRHIDDSQVPCAQIRVHKPRLKVMDEAMEGRFLLFGGAETICASPTCAPGVVLIGRAAELFSFAL